MLEHVCRGHPSLASVRLTQLMTRLLRFFLVNSKTLVDVPTVASYFICADVRLHIPTTHNNDAGTSQTTLQFPRSTR